MRLPSPANNNPFASGCVRSIGGHWSTLGLSITLRFFTRRAHAAAAEVELVDDVLAVVVLDVLLVDDRLEVLLVLDVDEVSNDDVELVDDSEDVDEVELVLLVLDVSNELVELVSKLLVELVEERLLVEDVELRLLVELVDDVDEVSNELVDEVDDKLLVLDVELVDDVEEVSNEEVLDVDEIELSLEVEVDDVLDVLDVLEVSKDDVLLVEEVELWLDVEVEEVLLVEEVEERLLVDDVLLRLDVEDVEDVLESEEVDEVEEVDDVSAGMLTVMVGVLRYELKSPPPLSLHWSRIVCPSVHSVLSSVRQNSNSTSMFSAKSQLPVSSSVPPSSQPWLSPVVYVPSPIRCCVVS